MTFSTRYSTNNTSFELDSDLGSVFTIRSYCDDPAGTTYLTKPPVCKLAISPNPQLLGFAMDWDIGDSSSTTGTVDTYSIDWGGSADISEIIDADFQFGPTSGTIIYNAVGIYTIEATVTDTTGDRSKPCFITVEVAFEPVEMQRIYFSEEVDTLPLVEFNFRDIPDVVGPNRWYSNGSYDMAYVAFDSGVANPAWSEGTGLTFTGAQTLVSAGFNDVAILGSDARTMMVRFAPVQSLSDEDAGIVGYGSSSALEQQGLGFSNLNIRGRMDAGFITVIGVTSPEFADGVMNSFAHAYTAGTGMDTSDMYIGGLPVIAQSSSSISPLATTASEIEIGNEVGDSPSFGGVITDMAIWDRTLLPAEILAKHNEWNS